MTSLRINKINNNIPNDIISLNNENMHLLQTIIKNSPKTPKNDITIKRSSQHRHQSGANQSCDIFNSNEINAEDFNNSTVQSKSLNNNIYSLVESFEDNSHSEDDMKYIGIGSTPKSLKRRNSLINDFGIIVKKTAKKIIFLVPAELESCVEIMKVQSITTIKTDSENESVRKQMFNSSINLPSKSASIPLSSDQELLNVIGPIRRNIAKNKKKRNSPYLRNNLLRNNQQGNDKKDEPMPYAHQNFLDLKNLPIDKFKFEIPESYVSRNFDQPYSSTVGPIRHKPMQRFHQNLSDGRSLWLNNNNIPNRYNHFRDSRPTRSNPYSYNIRNNNSKFGKVKLCWNCRSDSHLLRNCPLASSG